MTRLCFTISSSNVLLGLVIVRVYRMCSVGGRVHNVGNRGVVWNVISKLSVHKCLIWDIWVMMTERHQRNYHKLIRDKDCS